MQLRVQVKRELEPVVGILDRLDAKLDTLDLRYRHIETKLRLLEARVRELTITADTGFASMIKRLDAMEKLLEQR